jgi:hypothetical protein
LRHQFLQNQMVTRPGQVRTPFRSSFHFYG